MVNDSKILPANKLLGLKKDAQLYRARNDGKIFAVAFPVTAPDGYNGPINLLLAIDRDGKILGARVVSHKETHMKELYEQGIILMPLTKCCLAPL